MRPVRLLLLTAAQVLAGAIGLWAQTPIATVDIGEKPLAVGHNSTTNKLYVVAGLGRTLVEIDAATLETTTIPIQEPGSKVASAQIAVNPVTNRIYVINAVRNHVAVIDGATRAVSFVPTGSSPVALALNVVTNEVYVANADSNTVTIVDGARLTATQVPVGEFPAAIAVNETTNTIYVANSNGNSVSVIDGRTRSATDITVGEHPVDLAVDASTGRVYVANLLGHTITVIDGETHRTTTLGLKGQRFPWRVAVNGLTHRVYVTFQAPGTLMVIDGRSGAQSLVNTGMFHNDIALDASRDRVYLGGGSDNVIGALDGRALTATTIPSDGEFPLRIAVDRTRNQIFATNLVSQSVTIYAGP